jgi:hypothetical protein
MTAGRFFRVALVGFTDRDARYFRTLLELVAGELTNPWLPVARLGDEYEAILVDVDQDEGKEVWAQLASAPPVLIAASRDRNFTAAWLLAKPLRTMGPNSLPAVLNGVAARLLAQGRVPAANDPMQPLGGLIREAASHAKPCRITVDGRAILYIDAAAGLGHLVLKQARLIDLCSGRSHAPHELAEFAERHDFEQELAMTRASARPLPELLWLAAMLDAGEATRFARDQRLRLKRWPNFAVLAHKPVHLRMAAILVRQARSVQEVADACAVPSIEVARFVNACAELDLIDAVPGEDAGAIQRRTDRLGLLDGILGRLRRLGVTG